MTDYSIIVGEITWEAHHEWDDTTTQIDGYLTPTQLDMISASDLESARMTTCPRWPG